MALLTLFFFLLLYADTIVLVFFFLMFWPPPRSTLFPYTTLFRSCSLSCCFSELRRSFVSNALRPPCFYLRSEEHTSELQSHSDLVCRLLLEKKNHHRDPPRDREHKGRR